MDRLGAAFLGEYILADSFLALLKPKLTQQRNDLRIHINGTAPSVLGGIQKDALVRVFSEQWIAKDGIYTVSPYCFRVFIWAASSSFR